jgi:fatty acid desaturase
MKKLLTYLLICLILAAIGAIFYLIHSYLGSWPVAIIILMSMAFLILKNIEQ